MKKTKRLFPSIIVALSLIMVLAFSQVAGLALSSNTTQPLASGTVLNGTELISALAVASAGDTITLADDFENNNVTITAPTANVTIDGNQVELGSSTWKIIANNAESTTLTLNNFVFTGTKNPAPDGRAIEVVAPSPTGVYSKIILNNLLVENRYRDDDGGAIFLGKKANVEINNSTFHNNTVYGTGYTGGAIACERFQW